MHSCCSRKNMFICYRVFASRHSCFAFSFVWGRQTQCTCVNRSSQLIKFALECALSLSLLSQCWSRQVCRTTRRHRGSACSIHLRSLLDSLLPLPTPHFSLSVFPSLSSPFCVDKDSSAGGIAIGIAIAGARSQRVGGRWSVAWLRCSRRTRTCRHVNWRDKKNKTSQQQQQELQ